MVAFVRRVARRCARRKLGKLLFRRRQRGRRNGLNIGISRDDGQIDASSTNRIVPTCRVVTKIAFAEALGASIEFHGTLHLKVATLISECIPKFE